MAVEITFSMCTKLDLMLVSIWGETPCCGKLSGYESELRDLKRAVYGVRELLIDNDHHSNEDIRKLEDAVYDADDVIDELSTLADTNQLSHSGRKARKFYQKMSRQLKDTSSRLNEIHDAYVSLCKDEGSYIYDNSDSFLEMTWKCNDNDNDSDNDNDTDNDNIIVGRDRDKDAIITMLLHHHTNDDSGSSVGFLTIVGVGGLGKTALARLVFNDDIIKQQFPRRFWFSLTDFDEDKFRSLAFELKNTLDGNKFFIVLDDVWDKLSTSLLDFKKYVRWSKTGCKVLVTTRSMRIASLFGNKDDHVYMLEKLSKEDSWRLFQMLAFPPWSEEETHPELLEIGKNIVEDCYCNPLAIKVVADHLCGDPISNWQSFERSGLAKNYKGNNRLLHVLMRSYHNLESSTKSCFRYCAIFPKDVRIHKEKLIGSWIAHDYVVQEYDDDEQFLNLLDRCFFEDIVRDEYGDIESFKIHSLMHVVAQKVGKEEVCTITSNMNYSGNHIRHVHHVGYESPNTSLDIKKIRSYVSGNGAILHKQIDQWMGLRILDLSRSEVKNLPDSVGKLLHLRYLDLSHCKELEFLCDSVTQLYNLQVLDLHNCDKLTSMPSSMDKLTNIRVLPLFVVGNGISSKKQRGEGMLNDLEALWKLQGKICIKVGTNYRTEEESTNYTGGYLMSKGFLREIRVEFKDVATCTYNPENVLDKLEPPPNIKGLILHNYKGVRIGWWGRAQGNWAIIFPQLVRIVIWKCENLQHMAVLTKLPFLKILCLFCLDSLEYMQDVMRRNNNDEVAEFFPSLETLKIMWMEKLKGWWKMDGVADDCGLRLRFPSMLYLKIYKCHNLMSFAPCQIPENMAVHEFPVLRSMKIANCPNLAFNLICPNVETLELRDVGKKLQVTYGSSQYESKLRHVEVDKVRHLKPVSSNSLVRLCIHGDLEVESSLEAEDAFQRCASSLRELEIRYCANLREILGLEHLTTLEELKLLGNSQLSISEDEEEPWKSFHHTLLRLKFDALPIMKRLPQGMRYFTTLQILELRWCENLEELPQWMNCLSSLNYLSIIHCPSLRSLPEAMQNLTSLKNLSIQHGCPELNRRCRKPDGEDFHKIQHIPNISIGPTTI